MSTNNGVGSYVPVLVSLAESFPSSLPLACGPFVTCHLDLSIGTLTTWWLPITRESEGARDGRKQERKQSLHNLILEMTTQSLLSHSIYQKQIIRSSTHSIGEDRKAWLLEMGIFGSCFRSWLLQSPSCFNYFWYNYYLLSYTVILLIHWGYIPRSPMGTWNHDTTVPYIYTIFVLMHT